MIRSGDDKTPATDARHQVRHMEWIPIDFHISAERKELKVARKAEASLTGALKKAKAS